MGTPARRSRHAPLPFLASRQGFSVIPAAIAALGAGVGRAISGQVSAPRLARDTHERQRWLLAQFNRWSDEGFPEGVTLARQALAIDPSHASAAAMIGGRRSAQRFQGWGAIGGRSGRGRPFGSASAGNGARGQRRCGKLQGPLLAHLPPCPHPSEGPLTEPTAATQAWRGDWSNAP